MDITDEIRAMLSAQRFLLTQLYKQAFLHDPIARASFPKAAISKTIEQFNAATEAENYALADMHKLVQKELESFFTDVEKRTQQSADRLLP